MQKLKSRKVICLTLILFISSLLMSGCNHKASTLAVSNIEKTFKSDIRSSDVKEAILESAHSQGWKLEKETASLNALRFKKIFTKSKRFRSPPSKRGKKYTIDYELYLNVEIQPKSFEIRSSKENKDYLSCDRNIEKFNDDLETLKNSIYQNLVIKVL